jgi:acyl transferase domain-containing protein/aryl carrier-like protein
LHVSGLGIREEPAVAQLDARALGAGRIVEARAGEPSVPLVACGPPAPDVQVAIVDPESRIVCGDDAIGEVWVGGDSVGDGYWRRPDATREVFGVRLASGEGSFLRTGDLAFMRGGQLYITGRLKDLIVIRGYNHYPQDVESTVEDSHPALRAGCSAAFSIDASGEERLVVVAEVERTALRSLDVDGVVGAIKRTVAEQHDLQVHAVALLRPATLPKTSSGKLQRRVCRGAFLDGSLDTVAEWQQIDTELSVEPRMPARSREELRSWLIDQTSRLCGTARTAIRAADPFAQYGMDSAAALRLAAQLEDWLGRKVPQTLAYDYPTIEAVVDHLMPLQRSSGREVTNRAAIDDPAVAIIGLACRFPKADTPEAFWQLLQSGADAVGECPASRAELTAERTDVDSRLRQGAFFDRVDEFDAEFFGISPREAMSMDPQQRLLLEVTWEALERAGIAPASCAGTRTGVFVGISTNDYSQVQRRSGAGDDAWSGTGNALSIAANRLSYVLDLRGPSVAIDTACSSSLVALHLACQSLYSGDSDVAIAAGVNLILSLDWSKVFAQAQMLGPGARCRTFDADADGYVRGEGCGALLLKPLAKAREAGDTILAVVRGSAINQDGRSNGLTAPNGPSQQDVIRRALQRAGIAPAQVSYVEAHGSGTPLGDPIEIDALAAVLGEGRSHTDPLTIGSVKANIGHAEAAAGIAGVIKVVLAMQHRLLPPQQHFRTPNPRIAWSTLPITVVTTPTPWATPAEPVFAGVSGFGFGGTNAHVVLEGPPQTVVERAAEGRGLLLLSARSAAALQSTAAAYVPVVGGADGAQLAAICSTAAIGRTHFEHRAAVVADTPDATAARLEAVAAGVSARGVWQTRSAIDGRAVFLFPGQGAAYAGMASALWAQEPAFHTAFESCASALAPVMDVPLERAVFGPDADRLLAHTAYAQPAIWAVQTALTQWFAEIGVHAAAVIGHSVGEVAALTAAGVLTLEEAARFVAARGRAMEAQPAGTMLAVLGPVADVTALAAKERATIAAVNSPAHVVVAGSPSTIATMETAARRAGWATRRLRVDRAFHSPLMDGSLPSIAAAAADFRVQPPACSVVSTLTGEFVRDALATADYWVEQARQPVQFAAAIRTLWAAGYRLFVEIGPSATLGALGRACVDEEEAGSWIAGLRRGTDDRSTLRASVAQIYAAGAAIDWRAWDDTPQRRAVLPTYPFERRRHWVGVTAPSSPPAGLTYRIAWTPIHAGAPSSDRARTLPTGTWVVVGATGELLGDAWRSRGADQVRSVAVDADAQVTLAAAAATPNGLAGVIYAGALERRHHGNESGADLTDAIVDGAFDAIHWVRALVHAPRQSRPRLWMLTRGAVAVNGDHAMQLTQASVRGLGRVIAREHPDLWGGLLDIDARADDFGGALLDALQQAVSHDEDDLAMRSGRPYVARLVPATPARAPLAIRGDGTYLITGGTGALGLKVAAHLARRGARSIVLVARRKPAAPRIRAAIDAIVQLGADVRVRCGDVTEYDDMKRVLDEVDRSLPPLCAIVNAAGALADGTLLRLDRARFDAVCRPKIAGGWNLYTLARGRSLDGVVMFSSIGALIGSAGQANYAVANAFLDALAHAPSTGAPVLSINWGLWSDGLGAQIDPRHRSRLETLGITPLAEEEGLRAFDESFGAAGQIAVTKADWTRYAAAHRSSSLVRSFAPSAGPAPLDGRRGWLRTRITAAGERERAATVTRALQEMVARILCCEPGDVSPRRGFFDQGMDSLLAMELKNRLEFALDVPLGATATFEHPTVETLSRQVLAALWPDERRTPAAQRDVLDDPIEAIEQIRSLSPDELSELIARELGSQRP